MKRGNQIVFQCEHCGRTLDPHKIVSLELDQRVNEYHDFGNVPERDSQGWFDFGIDCAAVARRKARQALEKAGIAPTPFDKINIESNRRSGKGRK